MNKFITILGLFTIILNYIPDNFLGYVGLFMGCWFFISGLLQEIEFLINNK